MADKLTAEQRSWNMSRLRGKNTKPELLVRRLLHGKGYRYRLHGAAGAGKLPGNPDLVFAGKRKVIFVNGCFWHFHDCRVGLHAPKNNADFWAAKLSSNRARDAAAVRALRAQGYQVAIVWECSLGRSEDKLHRLLRRAERTCGCEPRGGGGAQVRSARRAADQ